ncbi:GmrSD restriction endonuclease domain-containing protein [Dermatophilus congolensis]|uniref:GmrSD restriction endonuclease domain-containing protein n=1 Tax=Dermatophilus congolensis TaxID=1863 RepID=UPI001AAE56B9|nr:HNH endonuclease [Dermatophilus congolensis]MBO3152907.1 HNH endonuclease [Dermatophilus congolensis]MBO3160080.1 HNH endonuclease [Dermatophilus congolensis]MBO3164195.1 HNH endonuclease [Dermatophilus congolensis]MBO3177740.1 HNH endonuclease [Dermatophilus congolensis]
MTYVQRLVGKRAWSVIVVAVVVVGIGLSLFSHNPRVAAAFAAFRRVAVVVVPGIEDWLPGGVGSAGGVQAKVSAAEVAEAKGALDQLPVVTRRRVEGYSREVFGPAWSDNTDAELGHNSCDTRNDVLAQQLRDVTFKEDARGCTVLTGVLDDPYTGKTIRFSKQKASAVQIDHVFPLSASYDLGASSWSAAKRAKFANDPVLNLLAADGPANGSKGDKTPGDWMPPNKGFHCAYAVKFIKVTKAYGLKLDRADKPALEKALQSCS